MKTLSIVCLAALLATNAGATTVTYAGLDTLVDEADGIVVGTVTGSDCRVGPDREIYTFVTVADLDILKGAYDQPTLTLRFQGGHVDGEVLEVEGSPRFALDDRVILFVRGNGEHIVPIVGWTQGVFRVKANADAVERVLDHDGNRVLSVRGTYLLRERTHASTLRIAGSPAMVRQSRTAKGAPGTSDDGAPSAAARLTLPEQAGALALPAPEFLATLRQQVSLRQQTQGAAAFTRSVGELRSIDDFTGVPTVADEGRAAFSRTADATEPVVLPQGQP